MNVFVINSTLISILILLIIYFIIKPYPQAIIYGFHEPFVRFATYLILYGISIYNPIIGILSTILIILLHLDYVNLSLKN